MLPGAPGMANSLLREDDMWKILRVLYLNAY